MTKQILLRVIDELDNPVFKRECLGCGEIYNGPKAFDAKEPLCPACKSSEYVNFHDSQLIPGLQNYA